MEKRETHVNTLDSMWRVTRANIENLSVCSKTLTGQLCERLSAVGMQLLGMTERSCLDASVLSICQSHYSVFTSMIQVLRPVWASLSVFLCGSACSAWKSFKEKLIQKLKYWQYLSPPPLPCSKLVCLSLLWNTKLYIYQKFTLLFSIFWKQKGS